MPLDGITTIDAAIKKSGEPDFEDVAVFRYPESEGQTPRIEYHRDIRFFGLSDVADIRITERPDATVCWWFRGKCIA